MSNRVTYWTSLSTEYSLMESPAREVPIVIWYRVFLWLDKLNVNKLLPPHDIHFFEDEDMVLAVQLSRSGDLRYAYAGRPQSWFWVEDV